MKILEPAPGLEFVCKCWQCKAKLEANEDDLVWATHFVGENCHKSNDYFIVCPICKNFNDVPENKLTTGFKKLAESKGLKEVKYFC